MTGSMHTGIPIQRLAPCIRAYPYNVIVHRRITGSDLRSDVRGRILSHSQFCPVQSIVHVSIAAIRGVSSEQCSHAPYYRQFSPNVGQFSAKRRQVSPERRHFCPRRRQSSAKRSSRKAFQAQKRRGQRPAATSHSPPFSCTVIQDGSTHTMFPGRKIFQYHSTLPVRTVPRG